ncbi:2-hydroxyhepta-2,4-diene-1,7-dioate isomerase [Sulfobacillus acidophilus TPY]|nr:2-hydroxyhepta-2,4-diene-1,7-dioate isomerase [Sulfobacillus acidophilus TPY]
MATFRRAANGRALDGRCDEVKLASGILHNQEELFLVTDQGAYQVARLRKGMGYGDERWTMDRVLRFGHEALTGLEQVGQWLFSHRAEPDPEPDKWLAPVPRPGKILCVGLNYRPHAIEARQAIPEYPVLFNKYQNAVVGQRALVHPPVGAEQIDYEAELVLVMGRRCRNVSVDDALHYVLGYMNGNDLSARDLQFRTGQWLLGKGLDGFGPMGPYLVTRDEIPDPDQLEISGRLNGRVVQHSNTREMIFSCAELVSYISRYMTLEAGDVIFTGTPEGVILGRPENEREWLKAGDEFTVEISGLGQLTTTIGPAL